MAERYPDFIIGGAPKCGTTSLHFILDQHPLIGLPDDEIHYFDADDPITHPDFFFHEKGELVHYDNRPENTDFRADYAARFAPFAKLPLIGEDSTTYLFSEAAPHRIKAMLPEVRLIFMLRDPVKRAYSQYWHLVKSGRVTCRFERALHEQRSLILGSTYRPHLKTFLDLFGAARIKVVLFEDFIADNQATLDSVTDFLGTERMKVDAQESWFNKTKYPANLPAQLALNQIGKHVVKWRYSHHLTDEWSFATKLREKLHYQWFHRINPIFLKADSAPPMKESTRRYLADHLSIRNRGLSDLLQRDLSKLWKDFTG